MEDYELMEMMRGLEDYLEMEKVFIKNPARCLEVYQAAKIAEKLFDRAEITITHDPLQLGGLVLGVNDIEIKATGDEEITQFMELISKADNFIVYPIDNETVRLAIMFQHALIRLP